MRIAHFSMGRVNPDSANGVDKTVYYLSKAQAAIGHDVAVFALTDKRSQPIPGVEVYGFPPRKLPFSLGDRLDDVLIGRSPLNLPARLLDRFLNWGPDVLHLHFVHIPQNIVLGSRARGSGIPYTVTINGGLSLKAQARNRFLKMAFRTLAERRYLEKAAFLHVISPQDLEGVRSYGVSNHTVIAPNGIDLDSIPADADRSLPAMRFSALENKRVFMFLGRLDPAQKALDLVIEGFALGGSADGALVIAGPDWRSNRAWLEAKTKDLGIADRVVFSGPLFGREKFDFLAAADVFVHPSRWEAGVPFSVLEAAASSKPTLLSAGADPTELFGRHGAGLHVASDPQAIAEGIRRFGHMDQEVLAEMGSRARVLVEREFSWEPIARKIIDAYKEHGVSDG